MSAKTTRTLLIRAMLKLVRAQKFSAITIDDICEKAEVSRRTFYRYYSDKHALLRDVFVECFFSNINTEECKDPWDIIEAVCKQIYSDKKFFSHSFEVRGQNGFWEEVRAILLPYFQRNFPSYGDADRMRDFFASTDIYRALTLLEEWITEVATGRPATEFPAEMLEPVANIKK